MPSNLWGQEIAEVYDAAAADRFAPEVLGPTVDLLAELAQGGPVLEFAVGTGRVALPLNAMGIDVHGIELSPAMADRLREKPGAERVGVTIGDMTTARAPGPYRLVYLVFNSIMNVTTQDEQVAVFVNAAVHLEPGGRFLVEVAVPQLPCPPAGAVGTAFLIDEDHVGVDTHDDPLGQITSSHHWMVVGDRMVRHSAPYRYIWPSELDLMARVAGLHREHRWAGWQKEAFTSNSTNLVAVYRR